MTISYNVVLLCTTTYLKPYVVVILTHNIAFNLCLEVFTVGPSGTPLLMWALAGNQAEGWTYASVILSNPAPFRVSFQAEVGGYMWTDIALDDITYTAECVGGGEGFSN